MSHTSRLCTNCRHNISVTSMLGSTPTTSLSKGLRYEAGLNPSSYDTTRKRVQHYVFKDLKYLTELYKRPGLGSSPASM